MADKDLRSRKYYALLHRPILKSFTNEPKLQKQSALKFAGRIIPGAKRRGLIEKTYKNSYVRIKQNNGECGSEPWLGFSIYLAEAFLHDAMT